MVPCAIGKSLDRIAPTAKRPTPGQLKIVSVTTAPPSRKPICRPISVVTGTSALRSAWRSTTRRSFRPLARAVRTCSAPIASSTAVRVMRATEPTNTPPRVSAGIATAARPSQLHSGPPRPVKGSNCQRKPTNQINTRASMNTGVAPPATLNAVTKRSSTRPL